jgi:FAD/FMN-containing dehydrogenase
METVEDNRRDPSPLDIQMRAVRGDTLAVHRKDGHNLQDAQKLQTKVWRKNAGSQMACKAGAADAGGLRQMTPVTESEECVPRERLEELIEQMLDDARLYDDGKPSHYAYEGVTDGPEFLAICRMALRALPNPANQGASHELASKDVVPRSRFEAVCREVADAEMRLKERHELFVREYKILEEKLMACEAAWNGR